MGRCAFKGEGRIIRNANGGTLLGNGNYSNIMCRGPEMQCNTEHFVFKSITLGHTLHYTHSPLLQTHQGGRLDATGTKATTKVCCWNIISARNTLDFAFRAVAFEPRGFMWVLLTVVLRSCSVSYGERKLFKSINLQSEHHPHPNPMDGGWYLRHR